MDMKPLVLVIEDDPVTLKLIIQAVLRAGLRAHAAKDALQGVALARRDRPDLILCDLNLPGLDGATASAALRDDPALAEVPVIFISADPELALKAAEFGAVDAIAKPFGADRLTSLVCQWVEATREA